MRLEILKICNSTKAQSAAKMVINAIALSSLNGLSKFILVALKAMSKKARTLSMMVKILIIKQIIF